MNSNNTVYVANRANNRVVVWPQGNDTLVKNITGNWSTPLSLFAITDDEIYVDNGNLYKRVDKWIGKQSIAVPVLYVCSACDDLFVSANNTLYCSMANFHQIVATSLDDNLSPFTIVAGTGSSGNTSSMLNKPYGIFVDINFDLYVADCYNHRVQRFRSAQSDGVTVAGSRAAGTITLNYPTAIVLDADNYLFIVDYYCRVVGSGPYGFRCVVGCFGSSGSAANQLSSPRSLSFDSYGNIFVADTDNSRIQKFILTTNSCGTYNNK